MSEYTPPTTYGDTGAPDTSSDAAASASAAKDKAVDAAQTGKQAAGEVAQTATTAAKDVAQETKSQAKQIAGKTSQQLTEQADVQKGALVDGLRSLVDQLESMTSNVEKDGIAVEAANKARDAARSTADWLDGRDPGEVLDGIRSFGRERPGAYLAGSLLAGVLAGRLTRGVAAVHTDDTGAGAHSASTARPAVVPSAGSDGPGRHEERYTDSDINSGPGLYSDSAISSRPTPGQSAPGTTL